MLPVQGKTAIVRLCTFYSMIYKSKFGFNPVIRYPMIGKLLKPLLEQLSEYQLALIILVFMHWRGANDDSDFERKRLENAGFPLQWMPSGVNAYRAFATNYLGIKFEDENEVKDYVIDTMRGLKLSFNEVESA